jgi:hypothetical protein
MLVKTWDVEVQRKKDLLEAAAQSTPEEATTESSPENKLDSPMRVCNHAFQG